MTTYAIFVNTQTYIPGDERSRKHPGHGYPEQTIEKVEVIEFSDIEKFNDWIRREEGRIYGKQDYRAFICEPVTVTKEVNIKIGV
jgi:hypothetical protein